MPRVMKSPSFRGPLALAGLCAFLLAGCGDSPEQMVTSARQYLAKNDLNSASIQLKNALQENGKLAEARFLLGTVNLRQNNLPGAVKELRRAGELGYPPVQVSPVLAHAMVQQGEFEQVLKEFDGKTLDDPVAQAQLSGAVGEAWLARNNPAKARVAFEAALAANPRDLPSRLGLGRVRLVAGDQDGALADADAVLAGGAEGLYAAAAHALRAEILLSRKQVPASVAALGEAVKSRPDAANYHYALISLLLQQGDMDAVRGPLDAMQKALPAHPLTRYLQAFVDFSYDRLAAARDHIAETVRLAPDFLPGRFLAGLVYARLNDHVLAQEHLGAVVGRAPQHAAARRFLAQSRLVAGDPAGALETLQPLLDVAAPDVQTLMLAGQIHGARGDMERASASYERAAAAKPEDAVVRTRLGVSRLLSGDSDDAMLDLEAAAKLKSSAGEADTALILAHLGRGEFDKASAAQARLEAKRPDDPQTYMLKGGILLAKKDVAAARAAFEKALALKSDHIPALISLSRLDVTEKHPQDAITRFERVIAANPKNIGVSLLLADLLVRTGAKPESVREVLERASRADPAAAEPRLALVQHDLRNREPKRALATAQEVAGAHPGNPKVFGVLGRAQIAVGDKQQAVAAFGKQASLQPSVAAPLVELAEAQRLAGDRAGAEQSLRKALTLKADLPEAQKQLVALLVEDKRIADALDVARGVQKKHGKAPAGWLMEGDIHFAARDWTKAAIAYRSALERQKAAEIAVRLHTAQVRGGQTAEAERTVNDWLRGSPDDIKFRSHLADTALAGGRIEEADRLYRKLDELRPNSPQVINNLAWIAGRKKDPQAISLAEKAQKLAPDNPAILDTLGMLQIDGGQVDKGVETLRRAVSLAPGAAELHMNLAGALARQGHKDEARKEYDLVLEKLPADSPRRKEVTALRDKL